MSLCPPWQQQYLAVIDNFRRDPKQDILGKIYLSERRDRQWLTQSRPLPIA